MSCISAGVPNNSMQLTALLAAADAYRYAAKSPYFGRPLPQVKDNLKMMSRVERDEEREDRILMEAIVDANGSEEQAMGWYYYLEDNLTFPFQGRCINQRSISPLKQSEEVTVLAMAPEDECRCEMFVVVLWMDREFAVPLSQIEGLEVDEETEQAIEDWHYWKGRGYQLCE